MSHNIRVRTDTGCRALGGGRLGVSQKCLVDPTVVMSTRLHGIVQGRQLREPPPHAPRLQCREDAHMQKVVNGELTPC
eukprot:2588232-Amphidinium_carterae.1